MISPNEKDPLDPTIYAQGMATLSSVFPAINFNPDLYYSFLEDLREDDFIGGVTRICREVTELYPNSNLVALIREHSEAARLERNKNKKASEDSKKLEYQEPDYEQIEKNKKDWYALKEKLKAEKDISPKA